MTPLRLRGLTVDPPLALAPMLSLSHTALRTVVARLGGVGLFFTEMLAMRRLPHETPKHSPLLHQSDEERPLFYQLVGGDPALVASAVDTVHRFGGAGIDLNLGCPAPQQRRQGAGAALVGDLRRLKAIVGRLRSATELPLSAKIRLAPQGRPAVFAELCRLLEGEGVDLLTIHARRPGEKFCRRPRWEEAGEVAQAVSLPYLVNGGIFSADDAVRALSLSGADGIMVGRGAVERPWLCRDIAASLGGGQKKPVDAEQMYYHFIQLLTERFAPERRLRRLQFFTRYYRKNFPFGHTLEAKVAGSATFAEAEKQIHLFFSGDGE